MLRKEIPNTEIPELEEFIKEQQAKDIECWSCNLSSGVRLRLYYRPPTNQFVVLDMSGDRHAEYHFDTIQEAVEKYNDI